MKDSNIKSKKSQVENFGGMEEDSSVSSSHEMKRTNKRIQSKC